MGSQPCGSVYIMYDFAFAIAIEGIGKPSKDNDFSIFSSERLCTATKSFFCSTGSLREN